MPDREEIAMNKRDNRILVLTTAIMRVNRRAVLKTIHTPSICLICWYQAWVQLLLSPQVECCASYAAGHALQISPACQQWSHIIRGHNLYKWSDGKPLRWHVPHGWDPHLPLVPLALPPFVRHPIVYPHGRHAGWWGLWRVPCVFVGPVNPTKRRSRVGSQPSLQSL